MRIGNRRMDLVVAICQNDGSYDGWHSSGIREWHMGRYTESFEWWAFHSHPARRPAHTDTVSPS